MITRKPNGVPAYVTPVSYRAINGKHGVYYVWWGGAKWYWSALGNDGSADSEEDARDAAKTWIRDSRQIVPAQSTENDNTL